jgi:hypothetical protein
LSALWPKVVGPEVARRSKVLTLEGDRLKVRLPRGAWRKTIGRMRGEILLRLREAAGSLAPRALIFVEGPVDEQPEPVGAPTLSPPKALAVAVEEASKSIGDPEIREGFRAAAACYLSRSQR